jgi:preprotein translocase subunit SecB
MNRSKFQFSNPELEKVEFLVNQNYNEEKCDGIEMKSNTEVQILGSNEAYVELTINIGDSTELQPFNICVKMGANFRWEDGIDEDKAKQLLNINAPAALLSYIRPLVANVTNCSKYPVLNIPFIDFTKTDN